MKRQSVKQRRNQALEDLTICTDNELHLQKTAKEGKKSDATESISNHRLVSGIVQDKLRSEAANARSQTSSRQPPDRSFDEKKQLGLDLGRPRLQLTSISKLNQHQRKSMTHRSAASASNQLDRMARSVRREVEAADFSARLLTADKRPRHRPGPTQMALATSTNSTIAEQRIIQIVNEFDVIEVEYDSDTSMEPPKSPFRQPKIDGTRGGEDGVWCKIT